MLAAMIEGPFTASKLQRATAALNDLRNAASGSSRILMLPDSDDPPAGLFEASVRVAVAPHVAFDLLTPPRRVALGPRCVVGTPVPEAAVHENDDARPGEDDVCPPAYAGNRRDVHAVAQPSAVQLGAQLQLGGRVALTYAGEPRPDLRRSRTWRAARHAASFYPLGREESGWAHGGDVLLHGLEESVGEVQSCVCVPRPI